jgi:hypothetical protein
VFVSTRFSTCHVYISDADIVVCRAGTVLIVNIGALAEYSRGFLVPVHLDVDAPHKLLKRSPIRGIFDISKALLSDF